MDFLLLAGALVIGFAVIFLILAEVLGLRRVQGKTKNARQDGVSTLTEGERAADWRHFFRPV